MTRPVTTKTEVSASGVKPKKGTRSTQIPKMPLTHCCHIILLPFPSRLILVLTLLYYQVPVIFVLGESANFDSKSGAFFSYNYEATFLLSQIKKRPLQI